MMICYMETLRDDPSKLNDRNEVHEYRSLIASFLNQIKHGDTFLTKASLRGWNNAVEFLIHEHANIELRNSKVRNCPLTNGNNITAFLQGFTALCLASWKGNTEIVRCLIGYGGANLDKRCAVSEWSRNSWETSMKGGLIFIR